MVGQRDRMEPRLDDGLAAAAVQRDESYEDRIAPLDPDAAEQPPGERDRQTGSARGGGEDLAMHE